MSPLAIATLVHATVTSGFSAFVALLLSRRAGVDGVRRATGDWAVLRPVEALTERLAARLAREAQAVHPAQTIVCVGAAPPQSVADVLAAAGALVTIDAIPDDAPLNRKTAHLAAATQHASARGERAAPTTYVQVDADVCLVREDLDALAAALSEAADDIAFAVPAPTNEATWGARVLRGILRYSPQSFAVVDVLAQLTGSPPAVAGKCVAIRAATLARIGGYASFAAAIADDVALVERVVAIGGRALRSSRAVAIDVQDATIADAHARMTRWLRVIRGHRPHLLFTYPVFMAPLVVTALLAIITATTSPADAWWALGAFCGAWGARLVLAGALARSAFRHHAMPRTEVPLAVLLGDLVLSSALVLAVSNKRITWRGRVYDLDARGNVTAVRVSPS